jgi:hypothetical protein
VSWWPALVFGWPAIILALILSVLGITRRRCVLLAAAAVITMPFSFYLLASPVLGWSGLAIPSCLLGAGAAIRYHRTTLAWLLLLPVFCIIAWVANAVLSQ